MENIDKGLTVPKSLRVFSTSAMGTLKVSKNRNVFMKTPFGPKSNVRISALLYSRAEILTIITLLFGPNGVFIK